MIADRVRQTSGAISGIDEFVVTLLHFEESTNLVKNEIPNKGTWRIAGIIQDTSGKFGSCIKQANTMPILDSELNPYFDFKNLDWTLDLQILYTDITDTTEFQVIVGNQDNSSDFIRLGLIENGAMTLQKTTTEAKGSQSSQEILRASNGTITASNVWHHLALVYDKTSKTLTLYINGISKGTSLPVTYGIKNTIAIARYPYGSYRATPIKFDEIRISLGIKRYSANFIPPTAPY